MKQSWDAWTNEAGHVSKQKYGDFRIPVRVVPWGECPYPQEQVPQVKEVVDRDGTILTPPFQGANKTWYIVTQEGGRGSGYTRVEEVLKKPAPTVEIGGKRYLESEAVERCKELEPVDA